MKEYPRRRDVREMLASIYEMLSSASYINDRDEQDFDFDILSEVRDLMRDGVSLGEALMAIASTEDVAVDDIGPHDEHAEIVNALFTSPSYRSMIADLIVNEEGPFEGHEEPEADNMADIVKGALEDTLTPIFFHNRLR